MLNGFQVAGTIRNCSFEAKNQLENILLISEFLWPALLLPVAGSKVCWFRFIAIFFMQGNSFWLFGFYPCLDIQWGRHFKNATWAWKCACHWARASYWCWHSCSDTRSYIFDHLTGITILYLAFFFFLKKCPLILSKLLWVDVAGGGTKGILVSERATDSTSGIWIRGRFKSNESLWASWFFGMFTLYLSISLSHWLTLLDFRNIILLALGCLILNQLVEESGGPEESPSEPTKADS